MSLSPSADTVLPERAHAFAMRNVHFDVAECDVRRWHPRGLHVSHFFNALSVRFPEGEKFFMNSVRHYRPSIEDPALLADIEAFIGQEAMHSREHRTFNQALQRAGFDSDGMEAELKAQVKRMKMPPLLELGVTCAAEHFTAIMSAAVLSDDAVLDGADAEMAAMWRWHALEETEHKAVAFDVFLAARKGPVSGYFLRCTMMLLTTLSFWFNALRNLVRMVRQDGALGDWRGWGRLFGFLFFRPGLARKMALPYLAYFVPGFHPWKGRDPAGLDRRRQDVEARLAQQQPAPLRQRTLA